MKRIIIKSPAKINFGLNIVEKREDGFHNIETIFYPLELADTITFDKSTGFSFESSLKSLETDSSNLIIRALRMIEKHIGRNLNVDIKLEKTIPLGAGLGGGSSNAAHTLLSLNELFELNIHHNIIKEMALNLGSDVPFFLKPIPSFATSRGEVLEAIDFEFNKSLLLINPGIHISTKWAYDNISVKKPIKSLIDIVKTKFASFDKFENLIVNDFEKIALASYPQLISLKALLYELGAEFALMSGSGSTFFAIFSDSEKAEAAQKYFDLSYFTFLQLPDSLGV